MHSAFNLLVILNSMFTPLLLFYYYWKGYVLSGEIALNLTIIIIIIIFIVLTVKPIILV